jgi:hypothetical protein
MLPTPNAHFADMEEPSCGSITAKYDPKDQIMPAGGQTAFEC